MKHRQFKTECFCRVKINEKVFVCNDLREVKKEIYRSGTRERGYWTDVVEKKTNIVNDTYLMNYKKEGQIFQKQVYSRWKEEQAKARIQQLTINILQ